MVIMIKATSEGIQNNWNKLLNLRGLSIYSMLLVEIFLSKEKGRHSESLFSLSIPLNSNFLEVLKYIL